MNIIKVVKVCFFIYFFHSWCIDSILHSDILECFSSVVGTVRWICTLTWYVTAIFHNIFFLRMLVVTNVHSFSLLPNHKEMNSIPPWWVFLSFLGVCSFDFKSIIHWNYLGYVILSEIHLFKLWIFLTSLVHFLNVPEYLWILWN